MSLKEFQWQSRAVCADIEYEGPDPFARPDENKHVRAEYEWCVECPVAFQCLKASAGDPDGIWGGMRGPERQAFLRKHPTMGNVAMREHQKILIKVRTRAQNYHALRERGTWWDLRSKGLA